MNREFPCLYGWNHQPLRSPSSLIGASDSAAVAIGRLAFDTCSPIGVIRIGSILHRIDRHRFNI